MLADARSYREAVEKGLDYLVGQTNPDGSVNPTEKGSFAYYKLPWALVQGGRCEEAARIVRRIVDDTMTEEGDFYTEKRSKFHLDYYTYENAWIVLAAHLLSFFDIAEKGWRFIERFQDPETGGFCSKKPYAPGANHVEDPLSTAWVCNVALHLGKLATAEKGAAFIQMLWDTQPDIGESFYYYWRPDGGLVLERPPEEPDDRYFRINVAEPDSWCYILGAQVSFLAKLTLVTGQQEHLRLAQRVREFAMRCHEDLFQTDSAGKFCYGNTFLYHATGDEEYLRVAERCADYLANDQQPEGYWMRGGKPTASSTAEFCVWLTNLLCVAEASRAGVS